MYNITSDLHTALIGGYIGEEYIYPTAIAIVISGVELPVIKIYYYGEPDAELKERFGY